MIRFSKYVVIFILLCKVVTWDYKQLCSQTLSNCKLICSEPIFNYMFVCIYNMPAY